MNQQIKTFSILRILPVLLCLLVVSKSVSSATVHNNNLSKHPYRLLQSASELDYPPFAVVQQDGSAGGFSVDLLRAVVAAAGLKIDFTVGPWHKIYARLINRQLDVLPLVSFSAERDKLLDFSAPYLRMHGTIFIRKGETSIHSEAGLKGKEVLVMQGDTAHEYAVSKKLSDHLILTKTFGEAIKLLSAGKHDAVIVQQLVGLQLIKQLNISNVVCVSSLSESSLKPVDRPLSGFEQKFCFAVSEGNKELLARLNEGLAIVITNGTYNELYDKWFGPILPHPPVQMAMLLRYLFAILLPVLFLAGAFSIWYFKKKVDRKTRKLSEEITVRKQTEEVLQEREVFLDTLIHAIPIPIFYKDRDGRYIGFNNAFTSFFGETKENLIGKTVFDISPPELAKIYHAKDSELFSHGGIQQYASQVKNARGQLRSVIFTKSVFTDKAGTRINGLIGAISDITERKQADQKLQESEEKFKSIFENANDGILIGDVVSQKFIMANQVICDMLGYTKEELLTLSVSDIHPEEELPYILETFKNQAEQKFRLAENLPVQRKDGTIFYADISSSPITLGAETFLVGIFRDITMRKQSQDALRMSENRFRDITHSMADWVWEVDRKGKFTYVSETVKNSLGYSTIELMGKIPIQFMPPEEATKVKEIFSELSAASKPIVDLENWYIAKDGTRICLLTNGLPVIDANGKFLGYRGVNKDISHQKKLEVEKRTLEMQLHQAQRLETIGTLAGGIAHDFNNILYPIIGFTEMMLDEAPAGSDLRENLNEVLTASLRAGELVQQLLTFSRQTEGEVKPMQIQTILKELIKLMRSSLPSTILIKQHIDGNCGKVLADPMHIHQIAKNFITNACHAMEKAGGTLTIDLNEVNLSAEETQEYNLNPGTFVCFSVSDTGHGIEEHIRDRIFEPYFTTKPEGKGTGLGLSVVHGIVKSYQGDIRVYSIPGKGTIFKVYLPIIDKEMELADTPEDRTPVPGGHEHILLVDDEEPILKMEKRMLEPLGYQVTASNNSKQALEGFRSAPDSFDLVITDMSMPGMAGDKLIVELKKIRQDIPVILCTGYSETLSQDMAETIHIDAFLIKPIVKKKLLQKIRTILNTKKKG